MSISKIYKGSASFGRFMSWFWAILATLISIILIVYGIKYINGVDDFSKKTSAKVISKNCKDTLCTIELSFVNDKNEAINTRIQTTEVIISPTIEILYNSSNEARLPKDNNKKNGIIMIFIAILILAFYWGWVYVAKKYEFAAAGSGFSSVYSFFK